MATYVCDKIVIVVPIVSHNLCVACSGFGSSVAGAARRVVGSSGVYWAVALAVWCQ